MQRFLPLSFLLATTFGWSGCTENSLPGTDLDLDTDQPIEITGYQIDGAESVEIDAENNIIRITTTCGTDLTQVSPTITVAEGNTISPGNGSAVDLSAPVEYTLTRGNLFTTYTVEAEARCITGFLNEAPTRGEIDDDDEAAAADLFFTSLNADNTRYVSFQGIKDGSVDLADFKVIWWHGDDDESSTLPDIARDPEVLAALQSWYRAGGSFYLSGYAAAYLTDLGRFTEDVPLAIGSGPGFDNPDTWTVNTDINRVHDMSTHPIFKGIEMTEVDGRLEFPVIGPGWREDHNYVLVEIPAYMVNQKGVAEDPSVGFNENPEAYRRFTEDNDLTWLATWGGINDYFMAGIVEFKPTSEYGGTAVWQGIGGIEYNQNAQGDINPTGVNVHQANINRLTLNTLRYLITR